MNNNTNTILLVHEIFINVLKTKLICYIMISYEILFMIFLDC